MPSDASIYSMIRPQAQQPGPLDQYTQGLQLRHLMDSSELSGLQREQLKRTMSQDEAVQNVFSRLQPGQKLEDLLPDVMRASPKAGIDLQGKILANQKAQGDIAHTAAQTGDINAGHISGAFAAIAKANGSDQGIAAARDILAGVMGPEKATATLAPLLNIPPELRLAYAVGQAGAHKVGQEAIKMFFPAAHLADAGGTITPVSTSTIPGGPAAGSAIPGGVPIVKTQTPDSVAAQASAAAGRAQAERHFNVNKDIETVKADPFGILGLNKKAPASVAEGAGLSGDEYLKTLAPGIASQVKALAEGKLAITPRTLQSPQGAALLQMAMQYEPGTDQTTFTSRNATSRDAATGALAKSSNALNTVAGHMAELADSADKLNNTRFPWANKVKNWASQATGNPEVNAFNLNLMGVADELERAYRGAGGSAGQIEQWKTTLGDASSPDQFKAVLAKGADMLQSKLDANQAQIDQGMKSTKHGIKAITPKAEAAFARLRGTQAPTGTARDVPQSGAPSTADIDAELRRRGVIK